MVQGIGKVGKQLGCLSIESISQGPSPSGLSLAYLPATFPLYDSGK
jgi:hypothetical protein